MDNSKPIESGLHSMKSDFSQRPSTIACNETSRLKLSRLTGKSDLCMKKDIQGKSQDIADINYSQFRNKLISRESHNSTFQKGNNIIVPGNYCYIYKTKEINVRKYFSHIISLYMYL